MKCHLPLPQPIQWLPLLSVPCYHPWEVIPVRRCSPFPTLDQMASAQTGSDAIPVMAQRTDGLGSALSHTGSTALPVVAQRTDGLGTTLLPTGSTALPVVAQRTDGLGTTLLPTRSTALPVVAQRTDGLGTTLLPTGSTALPIVAQRPDVSTVESRPTRLGLSRCCADGEDNTHVQG